MISFKNENEKRLFDLKMKWWEKRYDKQVRMCTEYRGKNGYHSRLSDCYVHAIRSSVVYAYDLLCRDGEGDRARAHEILYRVLPLQDIDPSRSTYGIWAYYLEEWLEEMNPPDWNWADFNAKSLLRMLKKFPHVLTDDIKMRMKDAVYHACRAIIKRNVHPCYTNISIMGAYVTLVAGEMFGWKDEFDYGKQRLQKLYEYNMEHGSFTEFNSPTYTFVSLFDLSDLVADINDAECKKAATELSLLAWDTVAVHFHKTTGQLAGPHFRAYDFMLDETQKVSIESALDYRIHLIADYGYFNEENIGAYSYNENLCCPEKYVKYFTENPGERILDQTFAPSLTAYTYLNDCYTVGSINTEKLWNQHRNVLGYFGDVKAPVAFNLKCLHDGWDYCSCLSSTVQYKGKLLNVLGFVTDAGDTHVNLDRVKNATISAEELRISWVFAGAVDFIEINCISDTAFELEDTRNGLICRIEIPYAVFDGKPVRTLIERTEGKIEISALLYKGERRDIDFSKIKSAAMVTSLQMLEKGDAREPSPEYKISDGFIETCFANLKIYAPTAPLKEGERISAVTLFRDGKEYRPEY